MFAPDLLTLCVGLRGIIYTEIEARGARSDARQTEPAEAA